MECWVFNMTNQIWVSFTYVFMWFSVPTLINTVVISFIGCRLLLILQVGVTLRFIYHLLIVLIVLRCFYLTGIDTRCCTDLECSPRLTFFGHYSPNMMD